MVAWMKVHALSLPAVVLGGHVYSGLGSCPISTLEAEVRRTGYGAGSFPFSTCSGKR